MPRKCAVSLKLIIPRRNSFRRDTSGIVLLAVDGMNP
jgi:hypothetical protein